MRSAGVLLHITSLPSPGGIGTLGSTAYRFADFLSQAGMQIWQMLPVGPTGYGESPYQSASTFAGNPLLIDIPLLVRQGILPKEAVEKLPDGDLVDYPAVISAKARMLDAAFRHSYGALEKKIEAFSGTQPWLEDYCLYMAIKERYGLSSWMTWPREIRMREEDTLSRLREELRERICYHRFLQYLFADQWKRFKAYANKKGILLFGDMPIYVAEDSSDTWAHPEDFQFDGERRPIRVAGVPPDYFSEDGQLWGNPLYRWDRMKKNGYAWWKERLRFTAERFDLVRIDHFIGFANYYSVAAGAKTARKGGWVIGPGKDLFKVIREECPQVRIIAEDLGAVNRRVKNLLEFCGYPGMKVLQFSFSGTKANPHHPANFVENCVAYTGTHDNDTTLGWFLSRTDPKEIRTCLRMTGAKGQEDVVEKMIAFVLRSAAETAVIPMQDFLNLDSHARMNTPGTTGGNWQWRLTKMPDKALAERIRELLSATDRLPGQES